MQEERKNIIRYALDYNIMDIHTYAGYKGDLVIRITVKDKDTVRAIRKYALSHEVMEVVIKENKDVVQYEIYCITEDEGAYHIKELKKHTDRIIKDVWDEQE